MSSIGGSDDGHSEDRQRTANSHDRRMGKDWAKGLTKATDARIARNAAAHRGKTYQRHVPPEQDRRHRGGNARTLALEWSDKMAYVVGLMATDGCLASNGRHLSFDSGDEQLVRTFLTCLGRPMRFQALPTASGGIRYKAQFGDVAFYRWLMQVGLMPRKSLVLGAIAVPDQYLCPALRDLFEGDGHISNFVHRPTPSTYPEYRYERLWVFFNSASEAHLRWIRGRIQAVLGVLGTIQKEKPREGRHDFFRLKYGNTASPALLSAMYPS